MYTIKKERGMIQSLKDMLKTTRKSIVNSQKAGEVMTQFDKVSEPATESMPFAPFPCIFD